MYLKASVARVRFQVLGSHSPGLRASSACLLCSARACSYGIAAGSLLMRSLSCSGVSCLWGAPSMILGPVLVTGFLQRNQAESHLLQRFIAYF